MGSTNFVFAVPSVIAPLKSRSSFPISVGLKKSPFVPVSSVIAQRRGNNMQMQAAATQTDVLDHVMQQDQVDHELMLAAGLKAEAMPKHVAIISDGHNRWAKQRGQPVQYGHQTLAPILKLVCRLCCKFGIKVLTSYLFSTETWHRPQVSACIFILLI